MPPDVAARLDAVLGAGERRAGTPRRGHRGRSAAGLVEPGHEAVPAQPRHPPARWRRAAGVVLVAAVSAAAVGAAGYALSASAGLNEPSARRRFQVQSAELAEQAREIAQHAGPERPHLLGGLAVRPYGHVRAGSPGLTPAAWTGLPPCWSTPGSAARVGHGGDRLPRARCLGPRVGAALRLIAELAGR